jgi:hypothetical protein
MKGKLQIAVLVAAVMLVATGAAQAAEGGPSRDEYVAQVEPICEANTLANKRILRNVRGKVRNDKLNVAGNQFIRASNEFRSTIGEIATVPRPPADDARLVKWFGFLKIVAKNLRNLGKALLEGDKIKAAHESVRVERSGNAANNVGFVFDFFYCRITPSRFS